MMDCNNCDYLNLTEQEQNEYKRANPKKHLPSHTCWIFNKQVKHKGEHPRLPVLLVCKGKYFKERTNNK